VNGDGFDDVIVSSYKATASGLNGGGDSYVIFGKAGGFAPNINLGALAPTDGFKIDGGAAGDLSGASVSSAGDVNGDGFADLMVGAIHVTGNGASSGAGYLIYGSDFTGTAVNFMGTAGNDILTGTAAAETFVGGQGNDLIITGGGVDAVHAGAGDDTVSIADALFRHLDGGAGNDTLNLDGVLAGQTLNLTALHQGALTGFEAVDMRGTGADTLTLNLGSVLNLSDTSNTLTVRGDAAADNVVASDFASWTQGADLVIVGTTYHSYTQGAATVLVENTMNLHA